MHPSNITIDADGSPAGFVAWYNHSTETGRIRALRPVARNDGFGVQRMEMLAIYFALADNRAGNPAKMTVHNKLGQGSTVNVRSDSKSSVEQLLGTSEVRDFVLRRICRAIMCMSANCSQIITFNHLDRRKNIAGLLLEQRRRRLEEEMMMLQYQTDYYTNELRGFLTGPHCAITA